MMKLTDALRDNTRLTELDLSSNRIESLGARSIASLLSIQTKPGGGGIKTLILGENLLRDEGVTSIAYALEKNESLISLWIDDNFIGAAGLAVLSSSLKRNSTLERIHLKHNSFQSILPLIECTFDKRSLDSVVNSNHTLKYCFLNFGFYAYESQELEAILQINRRGKVEARRAKVAIFLEEDLTRLFGLHLEKRILPSVIEIMGQNCSLSTMFSLFQNMSELFHHKVNGADTEPMEFEYL